VDVRLAPVERNLTAKAAEQAQRTQSSGDKRLLMKKVIMEINSVEALNDVCTAQVLACPNTGERIFVGELYAFFESSLR